MATGDRIKIAKEAEVQSINDQINAPGTGLNDRLNDIEQGGVGISKIEPHSDSGVYKKDQAVVKDGATYVANSDIDGSVTPVPFVVGGGSNTWKWIGSKPALEPVDFFLGPFQNTDLDNITYNYNVDATIMMDGKNLSIGARASSGGAVGIDLDPIRQRLVYKHFPDVAHNIEQPASLQSTDLMVKQDCDDNYVAKDFATGPSSSRVAIIDTNGKASYSSAITETELNYLDGCVANIQDQINAKLSPSVVAPVNGSVAIYNSNGTIGYENVTATEIKYVGGVTSSIQNQLNSRPSKAFSSNPSEYRVAYITSGGTIDYSSTINSTELGYLNGVTSSIQTQINAVDTKADSKWTKGGTLKSTDTNLNLKQKDDKGCYVSGSGSFRPLQDGSDLGDSTTSGRWTTVYYTSLNNGSDERLKDILEYPNKLLDVWMDEVKPKCYKYKADKSNKKRFGIIAQDVIRAFDLAGLDWKEFSVLQEDENGFLGVDYNEIQAIDIAAIRYNTAKDKRD